MPQIRCPNCGTTINLEARRNTDYGIILSALQKNTRTFSELLKITSLPRKTLSLRLLALRDSGIIEKDGSYRLTGLPFPEKWNEKMVGFKGISLRKPPFFTRKTVIAIFMMLTIGVVAASAMRAPQAPSSPPPSTPTYIGSFKMDLKVYDAINVYAWQVLIHFDNSKLSVTDVREGDFFLEASAQNQTSSLMAFHDFPEDLSKLFVGQSLRGDRLGVDGTGTLATITFSYTSENYEQPYIVFNNNVHTTLILQSDIATPASGTLMLEGEI